MVSFYRFDNSAAAMGLDAESHRSRNNGQPGIAAGRAKLQRTQRGAKASGALQFRLRLYDLSAGGCLVDSMVTVTTDRVIWLKIDLPDGNSLTVSAQIVLPPRDIGYAVRFIDLDSDTIAMIERALGDTEKSPT